ncbi:hypothetical protein [Nocardioides pinisoli]|uniref:Uncharacterized protein n=1 Tax=Nocardioides pinisoli TaxID=2950279 RepID=A0ABT1KSH7_9ACTN|nr:hypothetical protein [Nocardioides pinisoli]MCP3420694.1 hypothetical protein [Nocardioides pinisoli]
MKHDRDTQGIDLTGRIKSLEQFTGSLVARPAAEDGAGPDADVIPIHEVPRSRVPAPRRSRVFLRNGSGHGFFADLTVTAPRPRLPRLPLADM